MELNELIGNTASTLDNLMLLRDILNSGDCNICEKKSSCEYAPKLGQLVRYNCPFYEAKYRASKKYIEMFDEFGNHKDSEGIIFLIASHFSSDSMYDIEDCESNINELIKIKESIKESSISDEMKEFWMNYVDKGILVCEQEKERYTEDADAKKTVSKISVKQLKDMLEKYDDGDTVFLNIWGMSDYPSTELKIGDDVLMENDY